MEQQQQQELFTPEELQKAFPVSLFRPLEYTHNGVVKTGRIRWMVLERKEDGYIRKHMNVYEDITIAIHLLRVVNSDPNHHLCNKLRIVPNPYL